MAAARSPLARAHLVVGPYPPEPTGHDLDYARLRLLELLLDRADVHATVANDYSDIERWLAECQFLISYTVGPYLDPAQNQAVRHWLSNGGRWLAVHGSNVGAATQLPEGRVRMEKSEHHDTVGSMFLMHPPIRRFTVDVVDSGHPLTRGLDAAFEVMDELYFVELQDPSECHVFLTTDLPKDPTPSDFAPVEYDHERALLPDGRSRPLGYTKNLGQGAVAYIALGHCHSAATNGQPYVDSSVAANGAVPLLFRGPWETEAYRQLLENGMSWGLNAHS